MCQGLQRSGGVRVQFRVRFQTVKVPIFRGFSLGNPASKVMARQLF